MLHFRIVFRTQCAASEIKNPRRADVSESGTLFAAAVSVDHVHVDTASLRMRIEFEKAVRHELGLVLAEQHELEELIGRSVKPQPRSKSPPAPSTTRSAVYPK